MAAVVFQRNEVGIEATGQVTTVPDNDVAHLMYYLKCLCDAIECDDDPNIRRFTNYRNWESLSFEEQKLLVALCEKWNPGALKNVFVHNDELCGDSDNEFYTISQVKDRIVASESIVIAGRERHVSQIMTYTMRWMRRNYYDPIQQFKARLSAPPRRPALTYRPYVAPQRYVQQYHPNPYPQYHPNPYTQYPSDAYTPLVAPHSYVPPRSNRNKWICGIVIIVIIVAIIYGTLFRPK
jgi:hypothetical protein